MKQIVLRMAPCICPLPPRKKAKTKIHKVFGFIVTLNHHHPPPPIFFPTFQEGIFVTSRPILHYLTAKLSLILMGRWGDLSQAIFSLVNYRCGSSPCVRWTSRTLLI
jgi:hypothetical protein